GVGRGEGPLELMASGVLLPTFQPHCLLRADGVNSAVSRGRNQRSPTRGSAETRLPSVVGSARLASAQYPRSLYAPAVPGPADDCRGADVRRSPARPGACQRFDVAGSTGRSLHAECITGLLHHWTTGDDSGVRDSLGTSLVSHPGTRTLLRVVGQRIYLHHGRRPGAGTVQRQTGHPGYDQRGNLRLLADGAGMGLLVRGRGAGTSRFV